MTYSNAQEILNAIYGLGDRDWVFFDWLIGDVQYAPYDDSNDDSYKKDHSYGKTDQQIFEDAISLAKYLFETGDFEIGRIGLLSEETGQRGFIPYSKPFADCALEAKEIFLQKGLRCDEFYFIEFILSKKKVGTIAPVIPEAIAKLVQPPTKPRSYSLAALIQYFYKFVYFR